MTRRSKFQPSVNNVRIITMFNWLMRLLKPSKEDREIIEKINKASEEYDFVITGRYIHKKSKPEFVEKHRREHNELAERIHKIIENNRNK